MNFGLGNNYIKREYKYDDEIDELPFFEQWQKQIKKYSNLAMVFSSEKQLIQTQNKFIQNEEHYRLKILQPLNHFDELNQYNQRQIFKMIRFGIPISQMRQYIIMLSNQEHSEIKYRAVLKSTYNQEYQSHITFDDVDQMLAPTFNEEKNIKNIDQFQILNENGYKIINRVLWCLNNQCQFKISTLVAPVTILLLSFMNEHETFNTIWKLKQKEQYNKEITGVYKFHFVNFSEGVFQAIYQNFIDKNDQIKLVNEWIKLNDADYFKLILDIQKNFFLDYLQLEVFYYKKGCISYFNNIHFRRLIGCNEIYIGFDDIDFTINSQIENLLLKSQKIFKKKKNVIYILQSKLQKFPDFNNYFKLKCKQLDKEQISQLFQIAFLIPLPNQKVVEDKQSNNQTSKMLETLFIPKFQASKILTTSKFFTIWNLLPDAMKKRDFTLIFSSMDDGYSLQTMFNKCNKYRYNNMVLLIKDGENKIFGLYSQKMLQQYYDYDYYNMNDSFLFTLKPEVKFFPKVDSGERCLNISKQNIEIGLGMKGPALNINSTLQGHSFPSEIFQTKSFSTKVDGSFEIMNLEIYALS